MKIGVAGLWHLGTVIAACLADVGFAVVAIDDAEIIAGLAQGRAPLFEPGLDELLKAGIDSDHLHFSSNPADALGTIDILWIAYDTPVDADDRADVDFVRTRVAALLPHLRTGAAVLVSSQVPVGTTRSMRDQFAQRYPDRHLYFAYSPENLRLGKAISSFVSADRIVIGGDEPETRAALEPLVSRLRCPVVWMRIESAEMLKHTINAFLATSVTFINEIARLCELAGADAAEVEIGLRSEPRIGPRAYVTPGGAFAGGTLARDIRFLTTFAETAEIVTPLLAAVLPGNHVHGGWTFAKINALLGSGEPPALAGVQACVLGLTYKPGTSTLRRSTSIELCEHLSKAGARVRVFDPTVSHPPPEISSDVHVCQTIEQAVTGADVLIIATEWPEFAKLTPDFVASVMRKPLVIDQNGFLAGSFGRAAGLSYFRVGKPG